MLPISQEQLNTPTVHTEQQKGSNWGRVFTKIATTAASVAKVALVFGMFFMPALALPLYMNPGQVLARDGTSSCSLAEAHLTSEECSKVVTSHLSLLYDNRIQGHFTEYDLQRSHEKGISRNGEDNTTFRFLIPSKRMRQYQSAEEYARWAFTQDAWHDKIEKTIERIFKLHDIIKTNRSEPTQYRTGPKIVNSYFHTDDFSVHDLPVSEKDRNLIALSDPSKLFSPNIDQAAAWNKVLYLSMTMPDELPQKMQLFIHELHRRMQQGGDYIDHASFFHAEFTRLQPFLTSVGRIARVMMNIILETGELPHVVFKSHIEYAQKVREGTIDRSSFTQYLRESLAWTQKKLSSLDDPQSRRIINEARVMHPGLTLTNVGRSFGNKKINQQMYLNYQQSLAQLQQTNIMTLSYEELHELLNRLHILIEQNLDPDDEFYVLGAYRSAYMIVDGVGDTQAMILRAQSKLSSDKFSQFLESITKVQNDVSHLGALSEEEKELWAIIGHIPPSPQEVAKEMDAFLKQFIVRRNQNEDPVELAAFVHMELARIWPYRNGNGRLARMMMNEVLRQKGIEFITFPKRKAYYETVSQSIKDYSKFTLFLKNILNSAAQTSK